jgi:hypothetical protein
MGKGRFMGFVSKVGSLVGTVIPGAGVAGALAGNASKLMKDKALKESLKKEQKKANEKSAKIVGSMLGGSSPFMSKVSQVLSDAWEFTKKNWYIVLPAVIAVIWVLFFKKKTRSATRRRTTRAKYTPVRRKRSATPKGSAWAQKMLRARRAKARRRKK